MQNVVEAAVKEERDMKMMALCHNLNMTATDDNDDCAEEGDLSQASN